jgi:hypothetical protein
MFLHVTKVTYLSDYRLTLDFDDGTTREVDLSSELFGEVFEPLKNLDFFRLVYVNPDTNTIEWPNGADFAPEFLHKIGEEVKKTA